MCATTFCFIMCLYGFVHAQLSRLSPFGVETSATFFSAVQVTFVHYSFLVFPRKNCNLRGTVLADNPSLFPSLFPAINQRKPSKLLQQHQPHRCSTQGALTFLVAQVWNHPYTSRSASWTGCSACAMTRSSSRCGTQNPGKSNAPLIFFGSKRQRKEAQGNLLPGTKWSATMLERRVCFSVRSPRGSVLFRGHTSHSGSGPFFPPFFQISILPWYNTVAVSWNSCFFSSSSLVIACSGSDAT